IIEAPRGRVENGYRSETEDAAVGNGDGRVAVRIAVIADDKAIIRATAPLDGEGALNTREIAVIRRGVGGDIEDVARAAAAVGVYGGGEQPAGALDAEGVVQGVGALQVERVGSAGAGRVVDGIGAAEAGDGTAGHHDIGVIAGGGIAEVADVDGL